MLAPALRTERAGVERTRRGQVVPVAREAYLQPQLPCCSALCAGCPPSASLLASPSRQPAGLSLAVTGTPG